MRDKRVDELKEMLEDFGRILVRQMERETRVWEAMSDIHLMLIELVTAVAGSVQRVAVKVGDDDEAYRLGEDVTRIVEAYETLVEAQRILTEGDT